MSNEPELDELPLPVNDGISLLNSAAHCLTAAAGLLAGPQSIPAPGQDVQPTFGPETAKLIELGRSLAAFAVDGAPGQPT